MVGEAWLKNEVEETRLVTRGVGSVFGKRGVWMVKCGW